MKTWLSLYFIMVAILARCTANMPAEKSDEERIKDVHLIASIVEQFKEKTGHYPYEEAFSNVEE